MFALIVCCCVIWFCVLDGHSVTNDMTNDVIKNGETTSGQSYSSHDRVLDVGGDCDSNVFSDSPVISLHNLFSSIYPLPGEDNLIPPWFGTVSLSSSPVKTTQTDAFRVYAKKGLIANYLERKHQSETIKTSRATQPFNITLVYWTSVSNSQRQIFESAADIYESLLIATTVAGKINGVAIGQLTINISLVSIDGTNGIVGAGGPTQITSVGHFPITGDIHFDTADVPSLESSGQFDDVVLHEMGHVLGIGSLWDLNSMLSTFGSDLGYVGTNGNVMYQKQASVYKGYVPVQQQGTLLTLSSFHLFIFSSFHLFIFSSFHLFIFSSFHLFIFSSFHLMKYNKNQNNKLNRRNGNSKITLV
jgi:hypothetical protein